MSFTGYRVDDFRPFAFVTHDGGRHWQEITANLPQGPINVIKEDPRSREVLYVGTEFGVFVSLNAGDDWHALRQGIPRVAVHDLLIHPRDRDLVVGTHGRGIFIMDDVTPLQELAAMKADSAAHLFSLREAVAYRSTGTQSISGDRPVRTPNPPSGAVISYFLKSSQKKEAVKLSILNSEFEPVTTLPAEVEAGFHRLAWGLRATAGRRFAPPVEPGTYYVELQVGDQRLRRPVEVLSDPPNAD